MESYSRKDLVGGLRAVGLERGDLVFFQSQLYGLGRPEGVSDKEELCRFFLEALLEVLGAEGTLVVPTFTTQVARHDRPFVVEETVPNYGLFPEHVFRRPDFLRSRHPMWSVAATGPLKEEICRGGGTSNFGVRSAFDEMIRRGVKNVFAGIEIRTAVTIAHYMEMHYGVPHVYNKLLKWRPVEKGAPAGQPSLASVRYLDGDVRYDLTEYQEELFRRGAVRSAPVGGGTICAASSDDLLAAGYDGLQRDPYYFLAEPPAFDYGKTPYGGPSSRREAAGESERPAGEPRRPDLEPVLEGARRMAPRFVDLLRALLEKSSPSMRKALARMVAAQGEIYFQEGESLVEVLLAAAARRGVTRDQLIDSYLRVSLDTLKEQVEFRRTGSYALKDFASAREEVYDNSEVMEYYADGLMLTQVLWENHWNLMRFARNNFFAPFLLTSDLHLEVGPGHGYFTLLAFRFGAGRVVAYDVSEQSVRHTTDLLETQGVPSDRWEVHHRDVQAHVPLADASVSTAISGEVLEHIENPAGLLRELSRVLVPGGAACITTCANAPAIDHLYLFESAGEIREMIAASGLDIERDLCIEAGRIGDRPLLNYAAVLRKGAR